MTRRGWTPGPLLLTTTTQPQNAPRIDVATMRTRGGERYRGVVFGTGRRALVLGLRGPGAPPWLPRIPAVAPAPLRPVARFLFAPRPGRG